MASLLAQGHHDRQLVAFLAWLREVFVAQAGDGCPKTVEDSWHAAYHHSI